MEGAEERSLFDCAEEIDVDITNSCYKQGTCRECLVEILDGTELLTPRTEEERHLRGAFRLACRARIAATDGLLRMRPLRRGEVRILESGEGLPAVEGVLRLDPAVARSDDDVVLDGERLACVTGALYGLAIDVGTTTVVSRLVDLESGRVRATHSFENPQIFAGSDIMARIAYSETDHESRLRRTLIAYVNQAIQALPCEPTSIHDIAVAGNSTMRDLFFGLDVRPLGQSPYRSVVERDLAAGEREVTSLSVPARRLGLATHPRAVVYGLPLVGGHVGADAAACLLAVDALREDRLIAVMDMGTNTEILIGNRHRMMAASCPAGPAFEGGGLSRGMPAFSGAIESVSLDGDGGPRCRTIGGTAPRGICGSGLVDVLSELLRIGRMNTLGRIGADRFVLDADADVFITEADISRLAQAKAAQVAGWTLAARRYGIEYGEIERLYLAGGFASHLDVEAAMRIGLIPRIAPERVRRVGNAAIEGATLALRSVSLRSELEDFVKGIEHVELETEEGFFDAFVEGAQFKPFSSAEGGGGS